MLFDYARKNFDTVILSYLGNEITYQARLTNIDITASALVKIGVKENEKVVIMLPNIPEARYLIYACSKIGAIPNPINKARNSYYYCYWKFYNVPYVFHPRKPRYETFESTS